MKDKTELQTLLERWRDAYVAMGAKTILLVSHHTLILRVVPLRRRW